MSGEWAAFVAVLAQMPDVVERLTVDHAPDGDGRCPSCTTPGRGTAHIRWPCSLASLAADARRIAEEAGRSRLDPSVRDALPTLSVAGGEAGPMRTVRAPCARIRA